MFNAKGTKSAKEETKERQEPPPSLRGTSPLMGG